MKTRKLVKGRALVSQPHKMYQDSALIPKCYIAFFFYNMQSVYYIDIGIKTITLNWKIM